MEFLIEHAKKNVWCTPGMDKQVILALVRLTKARGVKNVFSTDWKDYKLPERNVNYHVFMVGHIPKIMLGVADKLFSNTWYDLKKLINNNNVLFNVYFGNGLEIPRDGISFLVHEHRGIILAIKMYTSYQPISSGNVYLRIYKNTYFESYRQDPLHKKIECITISKFNANQIYDFVELHRAKNNRSYGKAFACVKGIWYSDLDTRFIENKDVIDSIFDGSITDVIPFRLKDLIPFISTRDKLHKYSLHLPKIINDDNIIYYDDLDFLVGHSSEYSLIKAIRLNLNEPSTIRQLTHNDLSVGVDKVEVIKRTFFNDIDVNDMYIWVIVRNSGYKRNLWYINDRIRALYKMDDTDIAEALLGIDSNVFFWKGGYLEAGCYANLMGLKQTDIDLKSVVDCYGYRGIAKAMANTPLYTDRASEHIIDLPINFHDNALVIEYNDDGLLFNFYQTKNTSTYGLVNPECPWIGLIKGTASKAIYTGYNKESFEINNEVNYNFFKRVKDSKEWVNVTDKGDYQISDNVVTWLISLLDFDVTAIGDNVIYYHTYENKLDDNILEMKLTVDIGEGEKPEYIGDFINMAHYRVWLNGKALIRDTDFKVAGDSLIVVNKEYIDLDLKTQYVIIVADGIEKNKWVDERGFVEFNSISFNKQYDYYDDRLLRCITGGKVYPIEILNRPEDKKETGFTLRNGGPYIVENVTPALKHDNINFEILYDECKQRDGIISSYLSLKLPETRPEEFDVIPDYYLLYSPFLAKIIYDLNRNNLLIPDDRVTDEILDGLIKNYKYLLKFDPATWELNYFYISVHPHPFPHTLSVTMRQYGIIERLNEIYLTNVADLSPFLQIES